MKFTWLEIQSGIKVEEKKTVAKAVYEGQTYYFCAEACKRAFEKDPAKYVEA